MASDAPNTLNQLGQSLWLDNITRDLLDSGTLKRYIDELSVTGLTSNPTIFDNAISRSSLVRRGNPRASWIAARPARSCSSTSPFRISAGRQICSCRFMNAPARWTASSRWKSRRCSPTTPRRRSNRPRRCTPRRIKPNLFIKIPGTTEGLPAIEDSIFAGVPINVTLLFSTDQYQAAADAYMKGLERRVAAGLSADVRSVASLFVSRWDVAVADKVPAELRNTLGVAVSKQAYKAYRDILESDRFQRLENVGARAQRLLFASTGTKDKTASGHAVYRRPRRAEHGQHDARSHAAGLRRSWQDRDRAVARRR